MIKYNNTNIKDIMYNGSYISKVMQNGKVVYKRKVIPPNGVYIQDIDGNFYTRTEWNALSTKPTPNGVAVVSDAASFVIVTIDAVGSATQWSTFENLVQNIVTTNSTIVAQSDYKGEYNTQQIVAQFPDYDSAAKISTRFIAPNGKGCYLPSAGEWRISVNSNYAEINACLAEINLRQISYTSGYWASTQYSDGNSAWRWSPVDGLDSVPKLQSLARTGAFQSL